MKQLTWIAVVVMLTGAVMLVAGIGPAALWIAAITIGIAIVVIDGAHRRQPHRG